MANFNFNKVILGGRLTAEPELKQTPQGISVTTFTIAVNRRTAKGGEDKQTADFINCVAWRSTAEFVTRYFRKGSSICIVGSIQTRTWTDNQNQKRYATEVLVEEVNFVDSLSEGRSGSQQGAYNPYVHEGAPAYATNIDEDPRFEEMSNDDDLPF